VESLNKKSSLIGSSFRPRNRLEVLEKDPTKSYRWVNVAEFEKNAFTHRSGWELCHTLNSKAESNDNNGLKKVTPLDGTKRVGDLVLAQMPKEVADQRNEYYRSKHRLREEPLKIRNALMQIDRRTQPEIELTVKRGSEVNKY